MNDRLDLVEREVSFFDGEILNVDCISHRHFAATSSSPAEGGLEVQAVHWRGIDITKVLDERELSIIEDKVNEA